MIISILIHHGPKTPKSNRGLSVYAKHLSPCSNFHDCERRSYSVQLLLEPLFVAGAGAGLEPLPPESPDEDLLSPDEGLLSLAALLLSPEPAFSVEPLLSVELDSADDDPLRE